MLIFILIIILILYQYREIFIHNLDFWTSDFYIIGLYENLWKNPFIFVKAVTIKFLLYRSWIAFYLYFIYLNYLLKFNREIDRVFKV